MNLPFVIVLYNVAVQLYKIIKLNPISHFQGIENVVNLFQIKLTFHLPQLNSSEMYYYVIVFRIYLYIRNHYCLAYMLINLLIKPLK